jgi:hypothetical protein
VLNIGPDRKGLDSPDLGKSFVIASCNFPPSLQPTRLFPELTHAEGTLEVGYAIVIPEANHFIELGTLRFTLSMACGHTVVSEYPHVLSVLFIVRCDHAPFAGRDVLDGVKAENTKVSHASPPKKLKTAIHSRILTYCSLK